MNLIMNIKVVFIGILLLGLIFISLGTLISSIVKSDKGAIPISIGIFFVSYFLRLDKKKIIFIMSLLVSVTIEITQLIIGRVFDVDDIMLNVCGGILGYFVYRFIHHFKNKLPSIMKNDIFYNIVTTILIGIIIVYIIGVLEVI